MASAPLDKPDANTGFLNRRLTDGFDSGLELSGAGVPVSMRMLVFARSVCSEGVAFDFVFDALVAAAGFVEVFVILVTAWAVVEPHMAISHNINTKREVFIIEPLPAMPHIHGLV